MFTNRAESVHFLHGGHFPDCRSVIDRHFANYATLQFAEHGRIRLGYDGKLEEWEAPLIWFTIPGPRIRYFATGPERWNHHYIAFYGPLAKAWMQNGLILPAAQSCPTVEVSSIRRELTAIRRDPSRSTALNKLRRINALENLLIQLHDWRRRSETPSECPIIAALKEALQKNDFANFDYKALARQMGLSISTLRRRFRQRHSEPIHRFIQRQRIDRAKEKILAHPEMPLSGIAQDCGYCDEFYFSRHFKEHVGLSPSDFRRTRIEQ